MHKFDTKSKLHKLYAQIQYEIKINEIEEWIDVV